MVIDKLEYAGRYYGLSERFEKAFKYLEEHDFSGMEPGVYEICGKELILKLQSYDSRPLENCKPETHGKYADLQYIVEGHEIIRCAAAGSGKAVTEYDGEKDIQFWSFEGETATIEAFPGTFIIVFPEDIHCNAICDIHPQHVKKALIKVLL